MLCFLPGKLMESVHFHCFQLWKLNSFDLCCIGENIFSKHAKLKQWFQLRRWAQWPVQNDELFILKMRICCSSSSNAAINHLVLYLKRPQLYQRVHIKCMINWSSHTHTHLCQASSKSQPAPECRKHPQLRPWMGLMHPSFPVFSFCTALQPVWAVT